MVNWRNRSEQLVREEAQHPGTLVDYSKVHNRHAKRARAAIGRKKAKSGKKRVRKLRRLTNASP